jgi:hypothetical protein
MKTLMVLAVGNVSSARALDRLTGFQILRVEREIAAEPSQKLIEARLQRLPTIRHRMLLSRVRCDGIVPFALGCGYINPSML